MDIAHQLEQQRRPGLTPLPAYVIWQRAQLAACILLAPLSITLYLVAWPVGLSPQFRLPA